MITRCKCLYLRHHSAQRLDGRRLVTLVLSPLVVSASASALVGSRVRLSAGSYQDLANWCCNLLTRRAVCGRAAGNTPRTQKQARNCSNSVVALQDHCSYKAPTTNHHIKKMFSPWWSWLHLQRNVGSIHFYLLSVFSFYLMQQLSFQTYCDLAWCARK